METASVNKKGWRWQERERKHEYYPAKLEEESEFTNSKKDE